MNNTPTPPPAPKPIKEVPKPARFATRGYILSQAFTLRERLRILFGARLLYSATQMSEHNPGKSTTMSKITVTDHQTIREAVAEHERAEMAALKLKDTAVADGVAGAKEDAK